VLLYTTTHVFTRHVHMCVSISTTHKTFVVYTHVHTTHAHVCICIYKIQVCCCIHTCSHDTCTYVYHYIQHTNMLLYPRIFARHMHTSQMPSIDTVYWIPLSSAVYPLYQYNIRATTLMYPHIFTRHIHTSQVPSIDTVSFIPLSSAVYPLYQYIQHARKKVVVSTHIHKTHAHMYVDVYTRYIQKQCFNPQLFTRHMHILTRHMNLSQMPCVETRFLHAPRLRRKPSLYISVYNIHTKTLHAHIFARHMHAPMCINIYNIHKYFCMHTYSHDTCTHRRCPRSTQYPSYPSAPLCTLRARAPSALRKRKRPSASLPSTSTPPTSHFLPQHTPHHCTTRSTLSALLPSQNLPTRWECMRCRYALQLVFRQRALCLCVCVYIYMHIYVYSYICIAAALAPSATAAAPALQVRLMYVCIFMCMYT